jgi:hypothetical protein
MRGGGGLSRVFHTGGLSHAHVVRMLLFCACGRAEVLGDHHGQEKTASGNLTESSLVAFRERVNTVRTPVSHDDAETKPNLKLLDEAFQSKKGSLKASDTALRIFVHVDGYMRFQIERPPLPLKSGCERFFVGVDTLPAELQEQSPGRSVRSCIQDTETGDT